jgi:hypothetical protein
VPCSTIDGNIDRVAAIDWDVEADVSVDVDRGSTAVQPGVAATSQEQRSRE